MDSALIVSGTEKGCDFFTEMLAAAGCGAILTRATCGDARRLLTERDVDLLVIDAPLADEPGEGLARQAAADGVTQVILAVRSGRYDEIAALCEDDGVFTVSKPINRAVFRFVLRAAAAARNRLRRLRAENDKLTRKIEDIRIIDRAKCVLVAYLRISEQEAHRYVEKRAMDMRTTKRAVAEGILKTYED